MAVKQNTLVTTNSPWVRAVDYAGRFDKEIAVLEALFPNIRMIEHKPGEQLYSKTASVTLNATPVAEGDEIPYNAVTFTDVPVGSVGLDKQAIAPTLEQVLKSGYAAAQAADNDMLFKMLNKIANGMVTFMATGTLTSTYVTTNFAAAVAEAVAQVQNKWEDLNLGYSEIIGFVNTLDMYRYFGANPPATQHDFALDYIKDYFGVSKLFFSSKVPSGKVFATPAENLIMDFVDFRNPDIEKMGFKFITTGERGLIGVTTNPVKNRLVSELIAVTGVGIRAEYLDGIANINITAETPANADTPGGA